MPAKAQVYTPEGTIQGSTGNNNFSIGSSDSKGDKLHVNTGDQYFRVAPWGIGVADNGWRHTLMLSNYVDYSEIYNNGDKPLILQNQYRGFVGIGIKKPSSQLHLASDVTHAFTMSRMDGTFGFRILRNATEGNFYFQIGTGVNTFQTKIMLGEGLGTNTPIILNPEGGGIIVGSTINRGNDFIHVNTGGQYFRVHTDGIGIADMGWRNTLMLSNYFNFCEIFNNEGKPLVLQKQYNGNVLIGKTSQTNSSYKLDVSGKIRADEIVVNTTGADFVFEPTYKLRPLSELETFIKVNKHLPDIAPAKEMQENGVSSGEMHSKLLQKVEELTLYLIEKDKELSRLNQIITKQQENINALREEIKAK